MGGLPETISGVGSSQYYGVLLAFNCSDRHRSEKGFDFGLNIHRQRIRRPNFGDIGIAGRGHAVERITGFPLKSYVSASLTYTSGGARNVAPQEGCFRRNLLLILRFFLDCRPICRSSAAKQLKRKVPTAARALVSVRDRAPDTALRLICYVDL